MHIQAEKLALTQTLRIGVDIGGTFTDFVVYDPLSGALETFKLLSTPHNPAEAVIAGLARIRSSRPINGQTFQVELVHGSTVATNALLERKGARTAFFTTNGFADLLQIGRQNRPSLYDWFFEPAPGVVSPELCFEIDERVDHLGCVMTPFDPEQARDFLPILHSQEVSSIAICFLFSFLHPQHEQALAGLLRQAGYFVTASSELIPEFREYERASTTAVNAYVSPVLERYLSTLAEAFSRVMHASLRVMQSNGGSLNLPQARQNGVHCILSGPAGGIVGARFIAGLANNQPDSFKDGLSLVGSKLKLITFDMGGTSTDVALIDGALKLTTEAQVSGYPISIPMLDIHTIGAGGGSIARVDTGGALRVGPQSAGADPGPACYGRGDRPTVTDANLVLGRLAPETFLGGEMVLDVGRAYQALAALGDQLSLDAHQAALGVVQVANAHMERALRVISVERGYDPRQFTLLSFGGAGGLHAADLARRLGVKTVLVPPLASTLSALGMLAADVIKDYSQTVMLAGNTSPGELVMHFSPLLDRGLAELRQAGYTDGQAVIEKSLDMRYLGQSFELNVPYTEQFLGDFHALHNQLYGYYRQEAAIEIVNLRVRLIVPVDKPVLPAGELAGANPIQAYLDRRPVTLDQAGAPEAVPFYRGEDLLPGNHLQGPALVVRSDTTILLSAADDGQVDGYNNLWIRIGSR